MSEAPDLLDALERNPMIGPAGVDICGAAASTIKELEAKLEMATGALERIASGEFDGVMLLSLPPQDAARSYAARILAELKGDKG